MSKSDIPETWIEIKLHEALTLINGRAYKQEELLNKGTPVIRIQNLNGGEKWFYSDLQLPENKYCQEGDLLFAWSASFGPYIWSGPKAIYHYHIWKIVNQEFVDRTFAFKYLQFLTQKVKDNAHGMAMLHITKEKMEAMPFLLPPHGEQKRIVAKIESTQEKIKTIEQSVTQAEELIGKYREALLQKAFRGDLVPQEPNDEPASKLLERIRADRAKQPDGKKKKKDDLPPIKAEEIPYDIPKSWEWVRLGDIVEFEGGSQPPKSAFKYVSGPDLIRLVQIRDFKSDKNIVFIPRKLSKRSFSKDDIMIGRYGPPLFQILRGLEGSYNVALMKAVPSIGVDREYLFWFLQEPRIQAEVNKKSERSAGQTGINLDFLNSYVVPLPPFEAQKRIAKFAQSSLKQMHDQSTTLNEISDAVKNLQSSILVDAFSGRLVPQSATEGTGHELLNKIKLQSADHQSRATNEFKAKPKKRVKA